jgi:hypothetical protein
VTYQEDDVVVNNSGKPIQVTGNGKKQEVSEADDIEDTTDSDEEIKYLDSELNKQKSQIKINHKKVGKYKKLQKTTEKLSDVTEKYVEEKKASEASIKEYNLKIKCLLDENGSDPECIKFKEETNLAEKKSKDQEVVMPASVPTPAPTAIKDEVETKQAAPIIINNILPEQKIEQKTEQKADQLPASLGMPLDMSEEDYETVKNESSATNAGKMRFYPYMGLSTYQGSGLNNVQTDTHFGARFESKPYANKFVMGLGVSYKQLRSQDVAGVISSVYIPGYTSPAFTPEVEFRVTTLDLYGKFLFFGEEQFSPFISLGLNYNLSTLEYTQNYASYGYNTGNSVSNNYMAGSIAGGVEYHFTETIGALVELEYGKSFGQNNATSTSPYSYNSNYGVQRLQQLAGQFADASILSLQAGILVLF